MVTLRCDGCGVLEGRDHLHYCQSWAARRRRRELERVAVAEDRQIIAGLPCDDCGRPLRFEWESNPYQGFAVCDSCGTRERF